MSKLTNQELRDRISVLIKEEKPEIAALLRKIDRLLETADQEIKGRKSK